MINTFEPLRRYVPSSSPFRVRADREAVRPRGGLGEREREEELPVERRGDDRSTCSGVPWRMIAFRGNAVSGKLHRGRPRLRQRLHDRRGRAEAADGAAKLLGDAEREEARLGHRAIEFNRLLAIPRGVKVVLAGGRAP